MASTISVRYAADIAVVETFDGATAPDNTATFDGYSNSDALTASTSVPVTKHAKFEKALSSGTGTIDLTALPGATADETVNGTGLKVQLIKLRGKSTNANKITVTKGASNGYGLDAAGGSWTEVIDPSQWRAFGLNDSAPDIGGSAKTIDLSGTGSQILEVHIVMG